MVWEETVVAWSALSRSDQAASVACVPMDDPVENAIVVNALQRHAAVVVQKSLAEGFRIDRGRGRCGRRVRSSQAPSAASWIG